MAASGNSGSINTGSIDLGRAGTFAFDDKDWPMKVGLLFVIGLIPGLNVIMWSGYALTVARRVMFNAKPLPEWSEWSEIAVRGLLALAGTTLYYAPALAVGCMLLVLTLVTDGILALGLRCIGVMGLLGYALIANFLLTPAHLRFAQTDQFHVYTDFSARIQDLRSRTALFGTLFLYQTVMTIIALFIGGLLLITCVGVPVIITLAFLTNGYMLGSVGAMLLRRPAPAK